MNCGIHIHTPREERNPAALPSSESNSPRMDQSK